jgi:hypothetical protein
MAFGDLLANGEPDPRAFIVIPAMEPLKHSKIRAAERSSKPIPSSATSSRHAGRGSLASVRGGNSAGAQRMATCGVCPAGGT